MSTEQPQAPAPAHLKSKARRSWRLSVKTFFSGSKDKPVANENKPSEPVAQEVQPQPQADSAQTSSSSATTPPPSTSTPAAVPPPPQDVPASVPVSESTADATPPKPPRALSRTQQALNILLPVLKVASHLGPLAAPIDAITSTLTDVASRYGAMKGLNSDESLEGFAVYLTSVVRIVQKSSEQRRSDEGVVGQIREELNKLDNVLREWRDTNAFLQFFNVESFEGMFAGHREQITQYLALLTVDSSLNTQADIRGIKDELVENMQTLVDEMTERIQKGMALILDPPTDRTFLLVTRLNDAVIINNTGMRGEISSGNVTEGSGIEFVASGVRLEGYTSINSGNRVVSYRD